MEAVLDRDTLRSYLVPIAIVGVALFLCTGWALSSGSLGPYLLFVPVLLGVGLGTVVSTWLEGRRLDLGDSLHGRPERGLQPAGGVVSGHAGDDRRDADVGERLGAPDDVVD